MAKNQAEYFQEKKRWSKTKDSILSCYLPPFFQKVMTASRNGIVYVDAFAGQGKFDNGENGSPLIAIQKCREAHRRSKQKPPLKFIFAEARSSSRQQLEENARHAAGNYRAFSKDHIQIVSSCDEAIRLANSTTLKGGEAPSTIFYYLDPYGIKDMRLDAITHSPVMGHTEALVNFCSVGFVRDACAALKVAPRMPDDAFDISEGFPVETPTTDRIERLTKAVGTDEWMGLIHQFESGEVDFWEVEREVTNMFCRSASAYYRYVTNMPIKDMGQAPGSGGLLKYRLVHMSNYHDGCVLMNDNMLKRNNELQTSSDSLFLLDVEGAIVDSSAVQRAMLNSVMEHPVGAKVTMWELLAPVISKFGVFEKSTNLLKRHLGPLLDQGIVERVQKTTKKTEKPCNAFSGGGRIEVFRAL